MQKALSNLREFYRKVKLYVEQRPLPRWAKEDLQEMVTDHKEVQ